MRLSAFALALGAWVMVGDAAAFCRTTTFGRQPDPVRCPPSGIPIGWTTGCTAVRINPSGMAPGITPDQFRQSVQEAVRGWKSVVCNPTTRGVPSFELVLLPDLNVPAVYNEGGVNNNVVMFREVWGRDEAHDPMAAAITIVTFGSRTGVILDADTEFNVQALYRFSFDGGSGTTDLRTVATHELGHMLGLAHSPDRNAVMWYTAGQGERRRTPNVDDAAGICAIYPPGRAVKCDPNVRAQSLEGGGLICSSTPSGARARGALTVSALVALVLLVGRSRRRRA